MAVQALGRFVQDGHARWLGAWAAVIAAGLLGLWLAVQLVWSLLTPVAIEPAPSAVTPASRASAPVADVARWHLFGNGQSNRIAVDIAEAGTRTSLKLALHGTVADVDGSGGYALIADERNVERSYRVGDRIADGVVLAAVYADRVVLENQGRHETLDLPREALRRAPPASTAMAVSPRAAAADATDSTTMSPRYVAPNIATGGVDWERAQQALRDSPASALQQFDVQPVLEGTRLRGVRLGGGTSNPLAAAAGLQADDVVTAVNGVPLDSLSRGQELMDKLKDARHVTLTIERDGRSQTLEVDVPASP